MNSLVIFCVLLYFAILCLSPFFLIKSLRNSARQYIRLRLLFLRFIYFYRHEKRLLNRADKLLQREFDDGRALSQSNSLYMQSQKVAAEAAQFKHLLTQLCVVHQKQFPATVLSIKAKLTEMT